MAQLIKSCRYVYSELSLHSVCHRCSAREANRQYNWKRHQSAARHTQEGSARARVVLYHCCLFSLQTRCLSEPGARQAISKSQRERDLPISPRSPGLQLSSLVLAMRSRDSLSYVSSLNQTFYALKRPRLILLYLYFHDCFVLNARQ